MATLVVCDRCGADVSRYEALGRSPWRAIIHQGIGEPLGSIHNTPRHVFDLCPNCTTAVLDCIRLYPKTNLANG